MAELRKRVAVIGAGASGLVSCKACLEEDMEVVCYEKTDNIGGLWFYREEVTEGVASVMKNTVCNSSKEWTACSDFPPPRNWPSYLNHRLMWRYLVMYAENFRLLPHIKLRHEVMSVKQCPHFEKTGQWEITVVNRTDDTEIQKVFDGVMVCNGKNVFPSMPSFPGLEQFKGNVIHAHGYRYPEPFTGQRVLVVGLGNSGGDIAVDIQNIAQKVYLSSRSGSWILPRAGIQDRPFDLTFSRRFVQLFMNILPYPVFSWFAETAVKRVIDHATYRLRPKHRLFSQLPVVNDILPSSIITGRVVIKGKVVRFVQNGVIFEGDNDQVTETDTVILATGYTIKIPFMNETLCPSTKKLTLYKYVFPPHLSHPSLAVIGFVNPIGAVLPVSEMQARWAALVIRGKLTLPSRRKMEEEIKKRNKWMSKRFVDGPYQSISVYYISYLDEVASIINAKPNFAHTALTNPKLFWKCFFGPFLPYQYRLKGPHPYPGAKQAILSCDERLIVNQ